MKKFILLMFLFSTSFVVIAKDSEFNYLPAASTVSIQTSVVEGLSNSNYRQFNNSSTKAFSFCQRICLNVYRSCLKYESQAFCQQDYQLCLLDVCGIN